MNVRKGHAWAGETTRRAEPHSVRSTHAPAALAVHAGARRHLGRPELPPAGTAAFEQAIAASAAAVCDFALSQRIVCWSAVDGHAHRG
jgi:hypothetical protein